MSNGTEIKCVVHIRHNPTGETRRMETTVPLEDDGSFFDYSWAEGNYSCDCNRALFFHGDNSSLERKCGDGEYSLAIERIDTSEFIYTEFEDAKEILVETNS